MSQHWYDRVTGEPKHTINYSKGERPTTLRDAKKLSLVPSVTTVLSLLNRPGLNKYERDQLLNVVVEFPYSNNMDFKQWCLVMLKKAGKEGKEAAIRGAQIHYALEVFYKTGEILKEEETFIIPTIQLITQQFPGVSWISEQSFASREYGYGGTIDLHSEEGIIIDFKTKGKAKKEEMKQYNEHHLQTAAYAYGLNLNHPVRRYNVFISTINPEVVSIIESKTDLNRDWKMFESLLTYWQLANNYYTGERNENKDR